MKGSFVAALLCTTFLAPTPVRAEPVSLFIQGIGLAASGTTAAGISAAVAGGATLAGFNAGVFLISGIGGALGRLALSAGLSAIARRLGPKPRAPQPSDRMVNFSQAITPVEWVFGQLRKGGVYAVRSFQEPRRYYGVILAAHEIQAIDQWYLDSRQVEVVDGEVTTEPYPDAAMALRGYLGAPGQVADPDFVAAIPEWTTAHDMKGLAWVAAGLDRPPAKKFSDIMGNSPPTGPAVTPVIQGALVYDPRTDTTGYSNNAALVWAAIIENRLGEGSVDWGAVAIEADAADVLIADRNGVQRRKWTLNVVFSDDADYATLLEPIILACDGKSYETPEGKVGFYVGRYIEPDIALTDDDLRTVSWGINDFGQDPFTEFVAEYTEPANEWLEAASATIVTDPDARVNRSRVDMTMANNHNQAYRALHRVAKSTRAEYTMRAEVGLIGLELMTKRFVRVQAIGLDFVAEIADWQAGKDDASFVLELVSVQESDFDPAITEPAPPPRNEVSNDNTVPAPSGLAGSAIAGPGIEWTWNLQPENLLQEFRFRRVGATDWQPIVTITDGATDIITSGLVDGESYQAELRNITSSRRPSEWIASAAVQAVANSTAPAPVVGFAATLDGSDIDLTWTNANDDNHAATRLYRAVDSTDFADALLLDTVFGGPNIAQAYSDASLSVGNYVYWAASINGSGVEGTLAGPVSETVT